VCIFVQSTKHKSMHVEMYSQLWLFDGGGDHFLLNLYMLKKFKEEYYSFKSLLDFTLCHHTLNFKITAPLSHKPALYSVSSV
jgi:hypothetical protein